MHSMYYKKPIHLCTFWLDNNDPVLMEHEGDVDWTTLVVPVVERNKHLGISSMLCN